MTLRRYAGILFLFSPSMWGDVTVHYHTDIHTSAIIPAAALEQALGGLRDMDIRVKGNKAYSSQGILTSIVDLTTQEVILVDPAHKRFATVPSAQYGQQLETAVSSMPAQARAMLSSMKTNLESRSTGRSATIQGIQTEEREFVLTVDMPVPGGPATPAPVLKMVMQVWIAKPEETLGVPALQELKKYRTSAGSAMNLVGTIKQLLAAMPGLGDNLSSMIEEMSNDNSISLRTHTEIVMPVLALLIQQAPQQAGRGFPAGLDPNAPLLEISQEVVGLSADPVDDALFQVPADYQTATLEEVLKGAVSAPALPQFKQ
ncbi:MAG TPA: hypothetical protein VGQ49_25225 [Bryobacteraceae bacterium]|nr:hypothetical protein [Bryobacteraceae bacterium]